MNPEQEILDAVLAKPMNLNMLSELFGMRRISIDYHLQRLVSKGLVKQHQISKFRVFSSPEVNQQWLDLLLMINNTTIRSVLILFVKTRRLSQLELIHMTNKSPSTVSKTLNYLSNHNIIKKNYTAPGIAYTLVDHVLTSQIINEYYPTLGRRLAENTLDLFGY